MKWSLLLILFFSLGQLSYAQKQISGNIKSNKGAVAYANVMLKNKGDYILKFVNSDNEGKYSISIPDSLKFNEIFIEVSYLGYKSLKQEIQPNKVVYNFLLEEKAIDLQEIKVTNNPKIISIGDTLSYDVASFSRPEDRSIGDVIRRLPGVTVAENGQISYNGKAITNLYIHDDDLMDGRYGLATKVISKDMIKSIDVLQHHQPIKVLKNKIFTDDVAMNLVLKDENSIKLSGQAMTGAGLPEQFDAALNTMMFSKKFKMLNSLKANNSGVNFQSDFAQLGSTGLVKEIDINSPKVLLALGTAGRPDLPIGNYYLNKSGLVNANNLFNFKQGLQVKSNIQVFSDRNRLNFQSRLENYLTEDTIRQSELQRTIKNPFIINTAVTATMNKDNYFLNNRLSLNYERDNNSSQMDFNNLSFNQKLYQHTKDFSNDLTFTPALRNKHLLDVRWLFKYFNNPQSLFIDSGINKDILNEGISYRSINQYAQTPTFLNDVSVIYRILDSSIIKQNYQLGLINERQRLNSTLKLNQNDGSQINFNQDVGNKLIWKRDRAFFNAEYFLRKKTWEANLSIPVIGQSIAYKQKEYDLDKVKSQLFVNPTLRLKLLLNAEDYLTANYNINNSVNDISTVYRGTILTNYRSLYANSADLQDQYTSGVNFYYNFQRSIVMLFANAGVSYRKITVNSILSTELSENVQRTILLPFENDQSTLLANASLSKFIFAINTTASIKSSWGRTKYNQFINNEQLPFNNDNFMLSAGIESKLFGRITLSYLGITNWNSSKQKNLIGLKPSLKTTTTRLDQNISLGYSPASNLFFTIQGRHIYSNQASINSINYLFTDAKARYKWTKLRTDLELDISNLTNIKNYEVISLSSNRFMVNRYEIRGRMAILRATFNL